MFRRHAIVLFLSVPTTALLIAGCSDDEKATPQIIFEGNIQRGSVKCQDVGDLFKIGDFGNLAAEPPVPSSAIKDGQPFGQGAVSVTCSVTQAGTNEFNVDASVDLSGATGGFFTIRGKLTTSGEQHVSAQFASRKSQNSYRQDHDPNQADTGCRVTYTNPAVMGVAAGRVWGHIECPTAVNSKLGDPDYTCVGIADFRFENCAQ